jgi:uncharacterized protein (TIGR02271 family)
MTTEPSPYTGQPIVEWFDEPYRLKDSKGDAVGDIVEVNAEFIVVEADRGFLGLGEQRTYYIPRTYIAREDATVWYLTIDKDEIGGLAFTSPPTDSRYADWDRHYGDGAETTDQGRMRMVRFEEDLEAQKATRQAGEVRVRKEVIEETRTIEVPVRREEVHVERRAITDPAAADAEAGATAFAETVQEIRVPVVREEVEVRKVVRPVEEVVVIKNSREETRTLSDTVRKERFDVEDDTTDLESDAEIDAPAR